ncbi:hypothetical protein AFLA_010194 [Aspergillus flavus NRRL3357]|nr:hypothetical protein AFLA_010194 [Aspergillus flavus NRRL3357]
MTGLGNSHHGYLEYFYLGGYHQRRTYHDRYGAPGGAKRAAVNAHVFISKQGYLDRFSSAMVAAAGGDEDLYSQIEDLKFQNGDDIEQMYKVLGG